MKVFDGKLVIEGAAVELNTFQIAYFVAELLKDEFAVEVDLKSFSAFTIAEREQSYGKEQTQCCCCHRIADCLHVLKF